MKQEIKNIVHHAEVSEKAIEKYLVERCREAGLLCLKYSNPNAVGYPDRLVCLPEGKIVWVELKSKGKKPTKLQQIRHKELQDHGQDVYVIDSKPEVDRLVALLQGYKERTEKIYNNDLKL